MEVRNAETKTLSGVDTGATAAPDGMRRSVGTTPAAAGILFGSFVFLGFIFQWCLVLVRLRLTALSGTVTPAHAAGQCREPFVIRIQHLHESVICDQGFLLPDHQQSHQ